ncbi:patatin-like phospholipase family protein [Methylobacterium soli]|uniref:patatin-like phospholipase family protein n=1 Tax=Methylobacterium soli TaxID=553447 RepID=UPI001EE3969D|nr:patatin-like phospholipase family protein [Methylobacterium soli]GJE45930.1 putative NTE family protein [Methylobacterium soli]
MSAARTLAPASYRVPFLDGLDAEAVDAFRRRLEPVAVAGGRILFAEGEEADSLYVLVSGAVGIANHDPATGLIRRIARLRPPETVGEVALLSNGPRSATATVLRDSLLLRLSREAFDEIAARHPSAMLYFARLLADRLRSGTTRPALHLPMTFAVIGVTPGVSAARFGRTLATALGARTGCLPAWPENADETWFHAYETEHGRVVYAADDPVCAWTRLCLRRADHVLLLAAPGQPPFPALQGVDLGAPDGWRRCDLVIEQAADAAVPRAADPAIDALGVAMRHQVRAGRTADHDRLGRLVSGRARGLVLGGGGARGFAHLGVLRALHEADHTIDFVGGTSIGAVVAASVAMGWSLDEIQDHILEAFVLSSPLNDYTLPVLSLTRGIKVDTRLRHHFGTVRIEDLWLPFLCVSANLTTGAAMVHTRGDLVGALRASIAIPGLLPPVIAEDGVLVDGGTMNNLPADLLADLERGRVLAVDVGSDLAFERMPMRSWRGRMIRRLLGAPEATPGIAQLLLRAATVSSDAQAAMARERAAVVLRPPLAGIDLRDWAAYASVAEIGYRHASQRIAADGLHPWADAAP